MTPNPSAFNQSLSDSGLLLSKLPSARFKPRRLEGSQFLVGWIPGDYSQRACFQSLKSRANRVIGIAFVTK